MEELYSAIDRRNRRPQAQPEALRSDLYTRALWTMGDWIWSAPTLFQDLRALRELGLLFEPSGAAELHWTLLQFQTFPVRPDQTLYDDEQMIATSKRILDESPPIHITFRGISRTRFGLFLNGYPNYDINRLRDTFRSACSGEMVEPHPQDICHSTLFRFTQEPSEEAIALLDNINAVRLRVCDLIRGNLDTAPGHKKRGTESERPSGRPNLPVGFFTEGFSRAPTPHWKIGRNSSYNE